MGDELTVVRWRKYGKDRLYVNRADGVRIGWVDMRTGNATVEVPTLSQAFYAAVASYGGPAAPAVAPAAMVAVPEPREESIALDMPLAPTGDPEWVDVSLNRPGELARTRAEAELAAQRERSRIGSAIARALDMKTDERAWRVGASGEEAVGARLEKLKKYGWHVLHAVPVGCRGSDIDHVVIGPGGVYTVNTKRHPDKRVWVSAHQIRVDGHKVPYLRNSRFEAERAERLLSAAVGWPVPVKPVLVFLTGTLFPDVTIKSRPDDVVILDRMDIPGAFKRAQQRLSQEQVAAVFELARRSTSWLE